MMEAFRNCARGAGGLPRALALALALALWPAAGAAAGHDAAALANEQAAIDTWRADFSSGNTLAD